jgi:hypothetical protein
MSLRTLTFGRALLLAVCGVLTAFYGCGDGAGHRDAIQTELLVAGLLAGVIGAVLMLAAVIRYARNG